MNFNPLALCTKVYDKMFRPTPMSVVIDHEIGEAETEIKQTAYTIHVQQFLQHMALARKEALEDWKAGRNIRSVAPMEVQPAPTPHEQKFELVVG